MDDARRDAFLTASPALVGAIATLRADGSPWVVPVWYRWDGAVVQVWSEPAYPWVRRLADEPRVAFTVFENDEPLRAVSMAGVATVRVAPLAEIGAAIRAIVARYEPPDAIEATIGQWAAEDDDRALVTIQPHRIRAVANGET